MSRLITIYSAQLRYSFKRFVQYRVSLVFWILSMMLSPIIFISVWTAVDNSQGGIIDGFTRGDFATYYIILLFVNFITFAWTMQYWEFLIRNGNLSYLLLRPIHAFHNDLAENLIYKLVTAPFILTIAVIMILTFAPTFHAQWWDVLAFIPVLVLAYALRFIGDLAMAMVAFWIPDNEGFNGIYAFAVLFLSGMSAPLVLFPSWFQQLANFFPFRWELEFPVLLLTGRLTPLQTLTGIGIQCVWIVVVIGLLAVLWKRGLQRFSGVGL